MQLNTSKDVTASSAASPANKKSTFSDLSLRVMVAVPAIFITLICLIYFPKAAQVLIAAIGGMCLLEWALLIKNCKIPQLWSKLLVMGVGLHYMAIGLYGIYTVDSNLALIGLLILVWSCDVGAYICGRSLGGPKLMPRVSPKKTWSGALGGGILAFVCTKIFYHYCPGADQNLMPTNIFIMLMIIVSQTGDLLESAVKRYLKVKDSSNFIPGHGGFLDRFDSLMAVGYALILIKMIKNF